MSRNTANKPVSRFIGAQRAFFFFIILSLLFTLCFSPDAKATILSDESQEPPETAVPQNNAFTPAGQGTVVDSISSGDKEFLTITTEHGNTFFLIIDRERGGDNVYFLTEVTEDNLLDFVTKPAKDEPQEDAVPQPPTIAEQTEKIPSETEPDTPTEKNNLLLVGVGLLIVLVVGISVFIYFRMQKQKKDQDNAAPSELPDDDDDREEDLGEDEDEY